MRELEFEVAIITIGNLAVGGTGKTPHIAYLLQQFSDKNVAVLSRGYGRGTKGFRLVKVDSKPIEVGDEILMLKQEFPNTAMAVHENRALGIAELLNEHPDIELVLLDDAFQHRHVKPSINILLTEFKKPFYRDWVMPFGRLREWRGGYKRADAIVFTKCPSGSNQHQLKNNIDPRIQTPSLFSVLKYPELIQVHGNKPRIDQALLVTSIARPEYLFDHLRTAFPNVQHKKYRDHYAYSEKDLLWMADKHCDIICTSKDWVKIQTLNIPENLNIWVQKVAVEFEGESLIEFIGHQLAH
jgi:tetraacyldisaccharide 4'-kinase